MPTRETVIAGMKRDDTHQTIIDTLGETALNEHIDLQTEFWVQEWREGMERMLTRPPEAWAERLIPRQRSRPPALPAIAAALTQLRDEHQQAQEGP